MSQLRPSLSTIDVTIVWPLYIYPTPLATYIGVASYFLNLYGHGNSLERLSGHAVTSSYSTYLIHSYLGVHQMETAILYQHGYLHHITSVATCFILSQLGLYL